ncbi:MAG: oligosaccharide flippase family protein [Bacteroidetes bacterium]|nr:oligosaccharide flippase family protein [Bacteroidota bacterium]
MQKTFLSSLLITIFLNLLIKPLALFGIDATVQNRVGPEEYGLYFSLLNLSVILNMLLDLGINNYTIKSIAQKPEIAKRYFGKIFTFRLILFLIYFSVLMIFAFVLNYSSKALFIMMILGINQFFVMSTAYCRSHFSGFHFFKLDALISVLDRFLLILVGGMFLFLSFTKMKMTIELFVWIQFFCYFSTFCVSLFLLLKHVEKPFINWDLNFSLTFIKKSLPYAVLIVLMTLYTRMDGVMLERIHPNGAYESGIFAQGFRLLDALYMFGMIFAGLLFPMFSKQLKSDLDGVKPLLKSSGNLLMSGAILIVVVTVFNANFLLGLIYDKASESVPAFQWLMFGFLAICMNFIFGTLLTANGNLRLLNISSAFGIILNVGLNFYLIPEYGATGSAFASFVTQTCISLIQFIYCLKVFKLAVSLKTIFNFSIFITLLFLASKWQSSGIYLIISQLIIGVSLMFLLSFINLKNLKDLALRNPNFK